MPSCTRTSIHSPEITFAAPYKALFPICAPGGRRPSRIRAVVKSPSLALLAVLPVGGVK